MTAPHLIFCILINNSGYLPQESPQLGRISLCSLCCLCWHFLSLKTSEVWVNHHLLWLKTIIVNRPKSQSSCPHLWPPRPPAGTGGMSKGACRREALLLWKYSAPRKKAGRPRVCLSLRDCPVLSQVFFLSFSELLSPNLLATIKCAKKIVSKAGGMKNW